MAILLILCISLLLTDLTPSSALTRFNHLHSSSSNPITPLHDFSFTNSGHIDLTISSLSLSLPNPNSSLSFFLTPKHSKTPNCPLHPSNLTLLLLSFPSLPTNTSFSSHTAPPDGEYTLTFANCVPNLIVSLDLRSSMYNLDSRGRRQYLPAGATPLPTVYSISALLYFAIVISWILILLKNKNKNNKLPAVSAIHVFVFAALIARAATLLLEAENTSFTNRTGRSFHDYDHIFYITVFVGVLSAMFPHPMAMYIGVESFVLLFVLSLVMIGIVLVINKKLKEAAETTDEKVALRKLWCLKWIAAVFSYMYVFAGVVVCTLQMVTSYRYMWTNAVALEFLNLAFYVFVGCKVKPRK